MMHSPDSVEYSSRMVSIDEFCVTKRGDRFKDRCLSPRIVTSVRTRSPREIGTFEDQTKEKSGKETCTKIQYNDKKKQYKRFHNPNPQKFA